MKYYRTKIKEFAQTFVNLFDIYKPQLEDSNNFIIIVTRNVTINKINNFVIIENDIFDIVFNNINFFSFSNVNSFSDSIFRLLIIFL